MTDSLAMPGDPARLAQQIAEACDRIAPTWPLDRFIAVNPYAGWIGRPIADAAAALGTLAGTRLTPPRAWFRTERAQGRLGRDDVCAALASEHAADDPDAVLAALDRDEATPVRLRLVSDWRDGDGVAGGTLGWSTRVTHQVSQHCAAAFDEGQAPWRAPAAGLLPGWREHLAADRSIPWRHGRAWLHDRLDRVPASPRTAIARLLDALAMPEAGRTAYLTGVLLAISGWAAWCAFLRWEARLAGRDDDRLEHLLAIRLAWEWLLHEDHPQALPRDWQRPWTEASAWSERLRREQRLDWLLQRAAEWAVQRPLAAALAAHGGRVAAARGEPRTPAVQAVFCIDVRSEPLRRALEQVAPTVHTRGFAGFFGLPIAYRPLGASQARPQLPGLLAPTREVVDEVPEPAGGAPLQAALVRRRRAWLQAHAGWSALGAAPTAVFGAVEALGMACAPALWRGGARAAASPQDAGLPADAARTLRPRLDAPADDPDASATLAHGALTAMGLTEGFAPLVLLVGHAGRSTNNPHAAALDCGACGGHGGEVNARVLAGLLNEPGVRAALRARGIDIPGGTHFLPAVHDTTTDEVALHDVDAAPPARRGGIERLRGWLDAAGARTRAERAPALGLAALVSRPAALHEALRRRAGDWAQQRPEWGLAGNAALVIAPRARTRGLDLRGRVFLHDYEARRDPDRRVLALLLTAPMVVAHWISMQYLASAVDPQRYGSGNKLLHDVVGGRIGVFEGNGGDLRIGLPWQSLHDGQRLRHAPLRLSVFVEAPAEAIEQVLRAHAVVRELVEHRWLHLLRIEPDGTAVEERRAGAWVPVAGAAPQAGGPPRESPTRAVAA